MRPRLRNPWGTRVTNSFPGRTLRSVTFRFPTSASAAPAGAAWAFSGSGLIVLHPAQRELAPFERREAFAGGAGALMLVNYTASPVGPYRELLHVSGFFRSSAGVRPSVTRILVDSEASLRAGRDLWGFPKELADFEWEETDTEGFVRVRHAGRLLGEFAWRAHGPTVPVRSNWVPRALRTLAQPWDGKTVVTAPAALARVRAARLSFALVNPDLFPDVKRARPLVAARVTQFHMTFPPALTVQAAPEGLPSVVRLG